MAMSTGVPCRLPGRLFSIGRPRSCTHPQPIGVAEAASETSSKRLTIAIAIALTYQRRIDDGNIGMAIGYLARIHHSCRSHAKIAERARMIYELEENHGFVGLSIRDLHRVSSVSYSVQRRDAPRLASPRLRSTIVHRSTGSLLPITTYIITTRLYCYLGDSLPSNCSLEDRAKKDHQGSFRETLV